MRLRVLPIVEGHGEVESVRILLTRIWQEIVGGDYIEVLHPIRQPKAKLTKQDGLSRALQYASAKLGAAGSSDPRLILVLIDADNDCPAELAPRMLAWAGSVVAHEDVAVVIVKREYETWFVASAESLGEYLNLDGVSVPEAPEDSGSGKGWIGKHFTRARYSETADQPGLTAAINITLCRQRAPSFDKLCRELEARST
ncbi:MAG: DUF4276 family protein [Myxococcota bacterium]